MSALLTCLFTIALIQNTTPTREMIPLLEKDTPIKCRFYRGFCKIYIKSEYWSCFI